MNFCERLQGEDLLEFHQQVVLGFTSEEEVWSTMVPTDLPIDLNASTQNLTQVGGGGQGGPMTGIDSSGLMATPIDEPISYTNPCKCTNALFSFSLSSVLTKTFIIGKESFLKTVANSYVVAAAAKGRRKKKVAPRMLIEIFSAFLCFKNPLEVSYIFPPAPLLLPCSSAAVAHTHTRGMQCKEKKP